MVTALKNTNNQNIGTVARVYKYDQLQRLKEAQTWTAANVDANNSWTGAATTLAHYASYEYDLNGNITKQKRYGGANSTTLIEDLSYIYNNTTSVQGVNNKLTHVDDVIASGIASDDVDDQDANNYVHDDVGRLIKDVKEEINTISWTANGDVSYIQRISSSMKPDLGYKYNALGQCIAKIIYPKLSPGVINTAGITITFYALDGSGTTMASYSQTTFTSTSVTLNDFNLYGASRLGTKNVNKTLSTTPNFDYLSNDNRASAIVEITSSTYTNGQTVQYRVGSTNLNATYTWNTANTLAQNVANLVAEVNKLTVTTDVSAKVWWNKNTVGSYYIQLKYGQQANWNLQTLSIYVNGVTGTSQNTPIKRSLKFGANRGSYVLGKKAYELTNQVGSVMITISDRKLGVDDGVYNQITGAKTSSTLDGLVDFYQPLILAYSDYDCFGSIQTSRSGNNTSMKYGYQGSLKENEIKAVDGSMYLTEYRLLDTRLGRWLSIDPKASSFPWQSPYCSMDNNPISKNDVMGDITDKQERKLRREQKRIDKRLDKIESQEKKWAEKTAKRLNGSVVEDEFVIDENDKIKKYTVGVWFKDSDGSDIPTSIANSSYAHKRAKLKERHNKITNKVEGYWYNEGEVMGLSVSFGYDMYILGGISGSIDYIYMGGETCVGGTFGGGLGIGGGAGIDAGAIICTQSGRYRAKDIQDGDGWEFSAGVGPLTYTRSGDRNDTQFHWNGNTNTTTSADVKAALEKEAWLALYELKYLALKGLKASAAVKYEWNQSSVWKNW